MLRGSFGPFSIVLVMIMIFSHHVCSLNIIKHIPLIKMMRTEGNAFHSLSLGRTTSIRLSPHGTVQTVNFSRVKRIIRRDDKTLKPYSYSSSESSLNGIADVLSSGFGVKDAAASMKLKILKYPHPKLRQDNEEVVEFNQDLEDLCKELLKVMYVADGIGLAAPQVGINKRIMVFNEKGDPDKFDTEMILINPKIVAKGGESDLLEEGCLSFPMINGRVERSLWIDVEYQDVKGSQCRKKLEGFPARIFQHEYDHLDKVLFIDRIIPEDMGVNKKRLEKMVKKYGPGAAA